MQFQRSAFVSSAEAIPTRTANQEVYRSPEVRTIASSRAADASRQRQRRSRGAPHLAVQQRWLGGDQPCSRRPQMSLTAERRIGANQRKSAVRRSTVGDGPRLRHGARTSKLPPLLGGTPSPGGPQNRHARPSPAGANPNSDACCTNAIDYVHTYIRLVVSLRRTPTRHPTPCG
jgi:hypothetical protein